jgi:DNA topoisomerase-1
MSDAAPLLSPQVKIAVKEAGLRYVSDTAPGIAREKFGKAFRYRSSSGQLVTEAAVVDRIRHLAIPPAWTDVWICSLANGHIQATGRDARGRKQYRYHSSWREVRDEAKYERSLAFGRALPRIRRRVNRDLRQRGLGKTKVLAAMVRLLETTLIRVGNEEYARENHSFGLSTMRDRHVAIKDGTMHFDFRGKSGVHHEIDLHDPRLARVVFQAQDLPGQDLFQYRDENGEVQKMVSEDVNAYLKEIAGDEFSAKDFRTWAGTVLAAMALQQFEQFDSKAQAKKNVLRAIESVAKRLGNTPSVCRKCYIHPAVVQGYFEGETIKVLQDKAEKELKHLSGLRAEEAVVLAFLEQRLRRPKPTMTQPLRRSLKVQRAKKAA